jgi:hypothetical protein
MLYLHIGLPKTGSTSIQQLLAANRDALLYQGFVYPSRWADRDGIAHHALGEDLVEPAPPLPAVWEEVFDHLRNTTDRHTLVSTEMLSFGLDPDRFRLLRHFLGRCSAETETRVIVVLRRFDALIASQYLHRLKLGFLRLGSDGPKKMLDDFVADRSKWIDRLFCGLGRLRKTWQPWEVTFVRYIEGQDVTPATLCAMGLDSTALPTSSRSVIGGSLGLKAQSVLAYPDESLEEMGLSRRNLIELFEPRYFEFEDEVYDYDPLGHLRRRVLHERALTCAEEYGVAEYIDAFGSDEIPRSKRTLITPANLSLQELASLIGYVRARDFAEGAPLHERAPPPKESSKSANVSGPASGMPRP